MWNKTLKWPSFSSFLLVWLGISVLTWVAVCLAALVFMHGLLHRGLVPYPILLGLALVPILAVTLIVQIIMFVAARFKWRESPESNKRFVLIGTPPVTWLCLLVITCLAGGPDAFVPRL